MSKQREALQMALEAMEDHAKQYPHMQKGYTLDAIEALREALAEPINLVQEAAPDLLEALTLLESTCGEGWLEINNPIRVLARAAIAKAKGEA